MAWLDRQDIAPLLPGWVLSCETDIATSLRARCMIARSSQPVDANFITLPPDLLEIESIRDQATGATIALEDGNTGPLGPSGGPLCAYRVVGDCIEFLPHPTLPDPIPLDWQPPQVEMAWYQRPRPLSDPQDSNKVLEQFYAVYLFGVCKYGALFELDQARADQCAAQFMQQVTSANLWAQATKYSGSPLRAVLRGF